MNAREHREHLETFYKYQSWIFRLFALWKLPEMSSQRFRMLHQLYFYHILFVWVISFDVSCLLQFMTHITDVNEIIKVCFLFASSLSVFAKFCTIKLKNRVYSELVDIMHDPMFRPVNAREVAYFLKSKQLSCSLRNLYGGLSLCTLAIMLMTPYFVGDFDLPLTLYSPINIDTNLRYLMMYVYQCITIGICCFMNIAFESLSASFLIHIKGQLDILCDRLEHLGLDSSETDNDPKITVQLKDCIEYYVEILRITKLVENLISLPISVQVVCSMLVLLANFYVMSILSDPGDYATLVTILTYQSCMLSQIYILCYFPSEVTLKSQEIPYFLYSSNWVVWSKFNRKLALLMMTRFDIPIRIRSINPTYTFNLPAFTSIVNSSYSYFALLKRINS